MKKNLTQGVILRRKIESQREEIRELKSAYSELIAATKERGGFMKTALFVLMLIALLVSAPALGAGPYLVCDPQPGVDYYNIDTDGTLSAKVGFQNGWVQNDKLFFTDPGGTRSPVHVLLDESPLAVGQHTQKARACKAAVPPWNPEVCSVDSIPLAFTRPALAVPPGAPANTRLVTPSP